MPYNNERNFRVSIFIIGFTSLITQIILFRGLLSIFMGNELIIGIALSNWLLLTSLGVYLGRFVKSTQIKNNSLFYFHLILGFLPLLIIYLAYAGFPVFFSRGNPISLTNSYLFTLIYLAPFSILSGVLILVMSKLLSINQKANKITENYALGVFGGLVGGLLFNFVFSLLFKEFFSLKLLMIINLVVGLFLYFPWGKDMPAKITAALALLLGTFILVTDIQQSAYEKLFGSEKLIKSLTTPYTQIDITKSEGEINFYENGNLIESTNDVVTSEENVHYAMLQHPKPRNVLMISGGLSGAFEQLNKYETNSIDYVEINPELIHLQNIYVSPFNNYPTVNVIKQDARHFLKKYDKKYDVVLINLPDPINLRLNRYYTLSFFEELKQRIKPSGIISISLSSSSEFMNVEVKELHTALFSTLKLLFDNVVIIPGQRNYFLASDHSLTHLISPYYFNKGIINEYVNPYYIDNKLLTEKKKRIEKASSESVLIDYDYDPVVFHIQFLRWIKTYNFSFFVMALIVLAVFIYLLPRLHFVNLGIFTTGFSSASLQLILIFAFQTIFGYAYYFMGVFFTLLLIGIFLGSTFLAKKITHNFKNFSFLQYLIGILSVFMPVVLYNIQSPSENTILIHAIFLIFTLLIGSLAGIQFNFGTHLRYASISKTATGILGSDLLGGAMGALFSTILLIPLFGMIKVCLIIGIINFMVGLFVLIRSRKIKA